MISTVNTSLLRGGPSDVKKKKKKRSGKKKSSATNGNDSELSDNSDELEYFENGGGTTSGIVSHFRTRKDAGASAGGSKQEASVPSHLLSSFKASVIADPIELVVREVRAKSKNEFGEDAIRICVNAMFDSGKPYDNSDEVIKQLKIERGDVITKDSTGTSANMIENKAAPAVVAPAGISSVRSLRATAPKESATSHGNTVQPAAIIPQLASSVGTKNGPNTLTSVSRPGLNDSTGFHAMSMKAKLELAASHDPVSAGLDALSSWSKVIGPEKAHSEFFDPNCRAIEILFTSLLNNPSVLHSDEKARSNFKFLLQTVLHSRGLSDNSDSLFSKLVSSIDILLKQVQSARVGSDMKLLPAGGAAVLALAENLGGIVRRFSKSLHQNDVEVSEVSSEAGDPVLKELSKLETDIKIINARLPKISLEQQEKQPVSLKTLVAARDGSHEILELQRQAIQLLSGVKATGGRSMKPPKPRSRSDPSIPVVAAGVSVDELSNKILADVGESLRSHTSQIGKPISNPGVIPSLLREINDYDESISNMMEMKINLESQLAALIRDINATTAKRNAIRDKYVALAKGTDRLDTLAKSVAESFSRLDLETKQIEKELALLIEHASMDYSATELDNCPSTDPIIEIQLMERKQHLKSAFCVYLESEAAFLHSLVSRVSDLRQKQVSKSNEIVQYQKIGLQSVMADAQATLSKLKANCDEDLQAIRSLQECMAGAIKEAITPAELADADRAGAASDWRAPRLTAGRLVTIISSAQLAVHPIIAKFAIVDRSTQPSSDNRDSVAVSVAAVQAKEPDSPLTSKTGTAINPKAKSPWGNVTQVAATTEAEATPTTSVSTEVHGADSLPNAAEATTNSDLSSEKNISAIEQPPSKSPHQIRSARSAIIGNKAASDVNKVSSS